MELKLKNAINNGIEKIKKLHNDNFSKLSLLSDEMEETMLFNNDYNYKYTLRNKYNIILNKIITQKFLLNELYKIKKFINVSEMHSDVTLSSYGSLYFGDGNLYYSDVLINYNEEEIFIIICNHIAHYILGLWTIRTNEINCKSQILLFFLHIELINEKPIYSQSRRSELYINDRYSNVVKSTIIFIPQSNLQQIILNNKNSLFYIKINANNYIDVFSIFIIEGYFEYDTFNFMIKNNKLRSREKILKKNETIENILKNMKEGVNSESNINNYFEW